MRSRIVSAILDICVCDRLFAADAIVQSKEAPVLEPFSTICIEEKASGFNWEKGDWKAAEFRPALKYMVQKLSSQQIGSSQILSAICAPREGMIHSNVALTHGCYNMRGVGDRFMEFQSRVCVESWRDGILQLISCSELPRPLTFLPDGNFIALPWHSDISQRPENGYKDSLAISVGKCSKIQ